MITLSELIDKLKLIQSTHSEQINVQGIVIYGGTIYVNTDDSQYIEHYNKT